MNLKILVVSLTILIPSFVSAALGIPGIGYISILPAGSDIQSNLKRTPKIPVGSTIIFRLPKAISNDGVVDSGAPSNGFAALDAELIFSNLPNIHDGEEITNVELRPIKNPSIPAFSIGAKNLQVWKNFEEGYGSIETTPGFYALYLHKGKFGVEPDRWPSLRAYLDQLHTQSIRDGVELEIRTSKRVISFVFPSVKALENFMRGNQQQITESRVACSRWLPAFIKAKTVVTQNFQISLR